MGSDREAGREKEKKEAGMQAGKEKRKRDMHSERKGERPPEKGNRGRKGVKKLARKEGNQFKGRDSNSWGRGRERGGNRREG